MAVFQEGERGKDQCKHQPEVLPGHARPERGLELPGEQCVFVRGSGALPGSGAAGVELRVLRAARALRTANS